MTPHMARISATALTQGESQRSLPRLPCENAYVERVIGSIRRECLDYCSYLQRAPLASGNVLVCRLLPAFPNASLARKRLPGHSSGPAPQSWQSRRLPCTDRAAPSLPTPRRLTPRSKRSAFAREARRGRSAFVAAGSSLATTVKPCLAARS